MAPLSCTQVTLTESEVSRLMRRLDKDDSGYVSLKALLDLLATESDNESEVERGERRDSRGSDRSGRGESRDDERDGRSGRGDGRTERDYDRSRERERDRDRDR
jgi:hypothetical protein